MGSPEAKAVGLALAVSCVLPVGVEGRNNHSAVLRCPGRGRRSKNNNEPWMSVYSVGIWRVMLYQAVCRSNNDAKACVNEPVEAKNLTQT